MPRIFAGGREVEIPADENGNIDVEELRTRLNIRDNRTIIRQNPNGENEILPRFGTVKVNPYDNYMNAPRAKRGNYEQTYF